MNRVTHNNLSLYTGPSPATGYHWLSGDGSRINITQDTTGDYYNLVFPMLRVQQAGFDINTNRFNVTALGTEDVLSDEVVDETCQLSFSYLQHGIINELRMGLYANFYESGKTVYGDFQRPALSGIINRSLNTTNIIGTYLNNTIQSGSALDYRDSRNFFLVSNEDPEEDFVESYGQVLADRSNKSVVGMGNCYLVSYSSSASVGSFPSCDVTYVCDVVNHYSSPAYETIPALDPSTGNSVSANFAIPPFSEADANYKYIASVVQPSNITLKFAEVAASSKQAIYGTGSNVSNYISAMASSFSSLNIQSYQINLNLNRTPLNSLGSVKPLDRQVEAPVMLDFNVDVLDSEDAFNSFVERMSENKDFYISIQLANSTGDYIDVQYDFLRAKCNTIRTSSNVSSNKVINFGFQCNLSQHDNSKGFYISGHKNIYSRVIEF